MAAFLLQRPSDDWDSQGYSDEEGDITEDLSNLGMSMTDDKEEEEEKEEVEVEKVVAGEAIEEMEVAPKEEEEEDEEVEEGFDELKDLETMEKRLQSDERYSSPVTLDEV